MADLDQQRLKLRAAPLIAADRQGAQRIAVVALSASDDMAAFVLADLDEILPRELERRLDRFRAAREEIDLVHALRRIGHQPVSQRLHRLVREKRSVREGDAVELRLDRLRHRAVGMAEAGNRGAAGSIEIALAGAVDDIGAVARHRRRIALPRVAMEDMGAAHRRMFAQARSRNKASLSPAILPAQCGTAIARMAGANARC